MKSKLFLTSIILVTLSISCAKLNKSENIDPIHAGLTDWTAATHEKTTPDYATIFPQDKVNTLEISMTTADWTALKADMVAKNKGVFGSGGTTQGGGGGGVPPIGGGGGVVPSFGEDADYIAVSMKFNGKEWYKVGFRPKGNSTLNATWKAGIFKFPIRLKMDEFEDKYPEIKDQRFYGFKELSLSAGVKDNSLIRDKVSTDIFRMAGIPAAQTAFYKVYIDFGEGKKYCGVYTMIEIIDDSMVKTQFGGESGNIYKPESTFQTFNQANFEKKNNETAADWSDVQATVKALNDPIRTTNPAQWRTNLDAVFNTDHFIKWLAVNSTLVNWDTYGGIAHNHYLYNDPTKKLTWIPWDNNEALTSQARVPLNLSGVAASWPLIRYIADDAVYYAKYKAYVKDFNNNVFTTSKMNEIFDKATTLITPYVNGTEKEVAPYSNLTNTANFTAALPILKAHVVSRNQAVSAFLK